MPSSRRRNGGRQLIKLVVSDLDGTLIDRDEVLNEAVVRMVSRLKEQGTLFTVATGRVEAMADHYVKRLNIEIPYIACNGATIIRSGEVLQRNQIPASGLREMLQEADEMGMSIIYTIEGTEFIFRPTNWILSQRETFDRYHDERWIEDEEWDTLLIDKVTVLDDIRDGRIGRIDDMCKSLSHLYGYTRYTDKAVEIVERSSNKGIAVRKLADMLGMDLSEVMVIGDHQNDIEMLQEAGLGVVVANGIDAAKAVADYVCVNRSTAGVIEAVEKFCFQQGREEA